MSDPRNQAQAGRPSASRRGKAPSHLLSGTKDQYPPCFHGTVTFMGPADKTPYPSCAPQWRPPL